MEVTLDFRPHGELLTINVNPISDDDLTKLMTNSFNWMVADTLNRISYIKSEKRIAEDYISYNYWKDKITKVVYA